MRKGCVVVTVLLALAIAVAGYVGYRHLQATFAVSDELVGYSTRDSVLARTTSTAPAPGAAEHLTPERVALFIGALDSANVGWRELLTALDSMKAEGADSADVNVWESPELVRAIIRLPLVTRRAMVGYLNAHRISWEEYQWLKERAVAASGITQAEADSAVRGAIRNRLSMKSTAPGIVDANNDFFTRMDQLRAGGAIDSSDSALMAPHRRKLLSNGAAAFAGIETSLDSELHFDFHREE